MMIGVVVVVVDLFPAGSVRKRESTAAADDQLHEKIPKWACWRKLNRGGGGGAALNPFPLFCQSFKKTQPRPYCTQKCQRSHVTSTVRS